MSWEETEEALLEELGKGKPVSTACHLAGISRKTLYMRMAQDNPPGLAERVARARAGHNGQRRVTLATAR